MSTINELDVYLKIFCLLYADDTLILAESAIQLEKALEGLNTYCKKWALNVNVEKTKVIPIGDHDKTNMLGKDNKNVRTKNFTIQILTLN